MSKNKSVYTCETCSALFLCLKFFQEHRRMHADKEGQNIFTCTHCHQVFTSENESHLHSITHKNELPHSCDICQKALGISEEEIMGSRRSIGTTTDFHVMNISLDKPIIFDGLSNTRRDTNENNDDDEDDDDEDDYEEDEDDDDDDDEDEDEDEEAGEEEELGALINPGVTVMINNSSASPKKSVRPSRSTGKGKGNRKARITSDGDTRRKFICTHCGKSFKTKSHLQRHILTHTGEKPYHCNRCDQRFNQSSTLRNHVIALHTKEYPHTCNNCSKGFLMPAVLQKHLSNSECGKLTNQMVEGL